MVYSWSLTAAGEVASEGSSTFDTGTFSGQKQIDTFAERSVAKGSTSKELILKLSFSDLYGGYGQSWTGNWSGTWTFSVPVLESYTVSYNANGGSGVPSSQTKWYGKTLKLSSAKPTRTGYTFKGWATSSTGGVVYASGSNYTANAAVTLYAVWQINTWTVDYNANGGTGAPSAQTKTYGQTLKLSTTKPTRTNYNFKGWGTSSNATEVVYAAGGDYTTNAAITLYAVWELAYWAPRIASLTVNRCSSAGDLDDYGTYAKVVAVWECCQLLGANNAKTITFQYKLSTATTWTTGTTKSLSSTSGETSAVIGGGQISTDSAYDIRVAVSDNKDGSTTAATSIGSAAFVMDFLSGGKGVAFGKPASKENAAEFDFDVYCNKGAYDQDGRRLTSTSVLDCYPVGSIYLSINSISPASLFGGTWTQIKGRFLLGTGSPGANTDNYFGTFTGATWSAGVGSAGGQDYHELTVSEMPSHRHEGIYYRTIATKNLITLNTGSASYHVPWGSSDYAGSYDAGNGATEIITGNTGGGTKHNNMPPYYAVYMWRRTS